MQIVTRSFSRTGFGARGLRHSLGAVAVSMSPLLGQTGAEWYRRGTSALAKFDALLARVAQIANQTARGEIMDWVGKIDKKDDPLWQRYRVAFEVSLANINPADPRTFEYFEAANYRQDRITDLESTDKTFEEKVSQAEKTYGILPPPTVVTLPGTTTTISTTTDFTVPILIVGGGIALALLLS